MPLDSGSVLLIVLGATWLLVIILGLAGYYSTKQQNQPVQEAAYDGRVEKIELHIKGTAWFKVLAGRLILLLPEGDSLEVVIRLGLRGRSEFYLGVEPGDRVRAVGAWRGRVFQATRLINLQSNVSWTLRD